MDVTRQVALDLARNGTLVIEQKKVRLDHEQWAKGGCRGIVRLRLAAAESE